MQQRIVGLAVVIFLLSFERAMMGQGHRLMSITMRDFQSSNSVRGGAAVRAEVTIIPFTARLELEEALPIRRDLSLNLIEVGALLLRSAPQDPMVAPVRLKIATKTLILQRCALPFNPQ